MRYLNALKHASSRTLSRSAFLRKLRSKALPSSQIEFTTSQDYWKTRYEKGGNSGEGSYGKLAQYKAEFINGFCADYAINSALELGCGDGNQTSKLEIQKYVGVDISEKCIAWACKNINREGYTFLTSDEFKEVRTDGMCELGLSLDVVYHLIEDEIYRTYLEDLFAAASRFVLVYSSDMDYFNPAFPHVRHRPVVKDVSELLPGWAFVRTEQNPYHRHPDAQHYGSFADFHLFEKQG